MSKMDDRMLEKRREDRVLANVKAATVFERDKRVRNLRDGYKETKGLKNGHCNRAACQAPLAGGAQSWMTDHESFTRDGRLYYCMGCTHLFNKADRDMRQPLRCTVEEAP